MKTSAILIEGMSCGHCVMAVKKELGKLPGLKLDDVQIGKAVVSYDESTVTPAMLQHAVSEARYTALSVS